MSEKRDVWRWADTLNIPDETVEEAERLLSTGGGYDHDPAVDTIIDFIQRYEDRGLLGSGGMGQIRRAWDRVLERIVAIKITRADILDHPQVYDRFVREANITAGLQHPGVVPVYDRGQLPDGRVWYTMPEISGETLRERIADFHEVKTRGVDRAQQLRRLIEFLVRVGEAVTYAHGQGVVHRDLKPDNIMIGAFNDVLVLDWGIAMQLGEPVELDSGMEFVDTSQSISGSRHTLMGQVLGTPAYMSPEQASGALDTLGPSTDIYALGGILYEILSGRPPRSGKPARVLRQIRDGVSVPAPDTLTARPVELMPDELVELAMRALSHRVFGRPATVAEMSDTMRAWLDGSHRQAKARAAVLIAQQQLPRIRRMVDRAGALRQRAATYLGQLSPSATAEDKAPAWSLEDEAESLEVDAAIEESDWIQGLQTALTHDPESPDAHALLASYYRSEHEKAEAQRDEIAAARAETLLRAHDRGHHTAYLLGVGALTLITNPAGALVSLYEYVDQGRRQVPVFRRELGPTPLTEVPLPRGSYMLHIAAPGHEAVRYPVVVGRGEHWNGVPPGERAPRAVWLPPTDSIEPNDVYVPAGWFLRGGDPDAADGLPRERVWTDGFLMRRFPVTNIEYLGFLNALIDRGRHDLADLRVPRYPVSAESASQPTFERNPIGHYALAIERGQAADHPVTSVDWHDAMAFAEWESARTGRVWRLPDETEWAKAARGVDCRIVPWGNHLESSWARTLDTAAAPGVVPVWGHPVDESPYGVRGMAGNSRDWCINVWKSNGSTVRGGRLVVERADDEDDDYRSERGGVWSGVLRFCRLASRFADRPNRRFSVLGMRLLAPLDE